MNPRGMESDPYVTKEKLILIEDDPFQGSILLSSPKSIDQGRGGPGSVLSPLCCAFGLSLYNIEIKFNIKSYLMRL